MMYIVYLPCVGKADKSYTVHKCRINFHKVAAGSDLAFFFFSRDLVGWLVNATAYLATLNSTTKILDLHLKVMNCQ